MQDDHVLREFATPFKSIKTAKQNTQFGLDPSRGLTRERYQWYSDGTRFDSSYFSNGEGEIDIETTATGTDLARVHSSYAGQYVAQALAKPGAKLYISPDNVEIDSDNFVSLTNGRAVVGAFNYNASTEEIFTGIGIEIDTTGAYAFWKSEGVHRGDSPVPQSEWSDDQLDGKSDSGLIYDPSDGYILNFPYTWYNNGQLGLAILDSVDDSLELFHAFNPPESDSGRASLATPHLPTQAILDNNGDAELLVGAIGGMQYTLYGSESTTEVRDSYMAEKNISVGTATNSPLNPITAPGEPLVSLRREPEFDTVEIQLQELDIEPDGDIYAYVWDEWDAETALTGYSFEEPFSNEETETRARVDRSATAFDNTNSVFRKMFQINSGGGSKVSLVNADIDEKVPLDATRIVTVIGKSSSNLSLDYTAKFLEGF